MSKNKSFQDLLNAGPVQTSENGTGLSITYSAPENKLAKLRELYAAAMAANEISVATHQTAQNVANRYIQAMEQAAELTGIAEGTPFEYDPTTGVFTLT